ncbi:MFS transporter [Acetobacter garciniae]|uniref:MFS transporter n=1 Tax=Acetobacter garciniae TaxID=2817435 RepID=UPI002ED9A0EA
MAHHARWNQVAALFAAVVAVGSNAFILTPILREVSASLGTVPYHVAWAISAFGAATAVSSLVLSSELDRWGPARVLSLSALLLGVAEFTSSLSTHWVHLCLAQAIAGVAVGVLLPGTYATTAAVSPRGKEARFIGLVLTGWSLSLVFGVPFAAYVTEHIGWRSVYRITGTLSLIVACALWLSLRGISMSRPAERVSLRGALRIPGVAFMLLIVFGYMTAFYGTFAYFGEGLRVLLHLSAQGAGSFVFAYGLGFGIAGLMLSHFAPHASKTYIVCSLVLISACYFAWLPASSTRMWAFANSAVWGFLNQLGLNALIVTLNRYAAEARGVVMGIYSAVTYVAVFAGPLCMGSLYAAYGFFGVAAMAGVIVMASAASFLAVRVHR